MTGSWQILGKSNDDSEHLLDRVWAHATQDEYTPSPTYCDRVL